MATLQIYAIDLDGLDPATGMVSAAGGGDKVICGSGAYIEVHNGDATSTDVTLVTPEIADGDLDLEDRLVPVPAGATRKIAVTNRYKDPTDGLAHITYSKVTSLTIGSFRAPVQG